MGTTETVCFFGDWHGAGRYAEKAMHRLSREQAIPDVYVHVGDFGFSRHYRFDNLVNETLIRQNREMWVVPGNHEDYDWLEDHELDERGLVKILSNLYAVPRGYRWTWNGVRFLGLGGAYSIDRKWRSYRKSWWPQEEITKEDFKKAIAGGEADVLVSHEGPWLPFGPKPDINWLTRKDVRASKRGRDFIARTILETKVKLNVHGHHHVYYERHLRECLVVGLKNDGAPLEQNRLIVRLNEFKNK